MMEVCSSAEVERLACAIAFFLVYGALLSRGFRLR